MGRRFGFTLAEVLITLAIIGVVAALTIPTLMLNINKKEWDTADEVFKRRFEETMRVMNVKEAISGYKTTKEFVTAFSENMKLGKVCASDKLNECFGEVFELDGEEISTNDISTSSNLGKDDWESEVIGFVSNSGVSALLTYNKNCKQVNPYSNETSEVTKCIAMVYDVNGQSNPNTLTKDIRTYGEVTIKNKLIPELPQGTAYDFEWEDDKYTNFRTTDGRCSCSYSGENHASCFCRSTFTQIECNRTSVDSSWSCYESDHSGGGGAN